MLHLELLLNGFDVTSSTVSITVITSTMQTSQSAEYENTRVSTLCGSTIHPLLHCSLMALVDLDHAPRVQRVFVAN